MELCKRAGSLFSRQLRSLASGTSSGFSSLAARSGSLLKADLSINGGIASESYTLEWLTSCLTQVRHRTIRRRIVGPPRPPLPNRKMPEAHKYNWIPYLPEDGHYTTKPLKIRKLGGRDPETGRVVVRTLGGGNKKYFRWIDYKRTAPEGETIEEKVFNVRYDPLHTHLLALVARGGHKRWVIASEFTKPGDIIKTHNIIPRNPIVGVDGDAYPLGALVPKTLVHCIERAPGDGAHFCINAGTHATIIRRLPGKVVVKMPSTREITFDEKCMAVVGKVSNPKHYTVNLLVPHRLRWKGWRQQSGLWHKKDGYCGRKMRKPKPLVSTAPTLKKTEYQSIHLL